jgi:hypothetical protein
MVTDMLLLISYGVQIQVNIYMHCPYVMSLNSCGQ